MGYNEAYDFLLYAIRVLFLLGTPLVLVAAAAGVVSGAFQGLTTIRDPAIGYALRVTGVVLVLYFMLPGTISEFTALAERAFGP